MKRASLKTAYRKLQDRLTTLKEIARETEAKIGAALRDDNDRPAALKAFAAVEARLAKVQESVSAVRSAIAKTEPKK